MFNKLLLALFILFIVALLGWCSPQCSHQTASVANDAPTTTDAGNSVANTAAGAAATVTGTTAESMDTAAGNIAATANAVIEKGDNAGKALSGSVGNAGEGAATAAEQISDDLKSLAGNQQVEEPAPRPEDFAPISGSSTSGETVDDASDLAAPTTNTADGLSSTNEKPDSVLTGDSGDAGNIVLEGVNFHSNASELTAESTAILDTVIIDLKRNAAIIVEIAGHTDNTGDPAYNLDLSQRRAQVVVDYLVNGGIAAERLTAKGYGGASPIADNATAAGRAKNRRVELHTR